MFLKLADEEAYHARAFAKIGAEVKTAEPLDAEIDAYLQALLASSLFPTKKEVRLETGLVEAIAVGIQAEKDSILLYQQLYDSTESDGARKFIGELLKAEKLHLVELRELVDQLQQENGKGT